MTTNESTRQPVSIVCADDDATPPFLAPVDEGTGVDVAPVLMPRVEFSWVRTPAA